ncbi:MAG: hypothetical protein QOD70_852 [Frankiales bacterium]|jgi:hypothetical protein|nr:hypothetical protein [Frankiales bacterium]
MSTHPARRFATLGIGSLLAAVLIVVAYLAVLDVRLHRAMDRATARVVGVVVSVDPDDDTVFWARWEDQQGREHTQRFSTYDAYANGDEFGVSFDPLHPERKAFATDPEERTEADDFEVPMVLAALGALGFIAGWGYRWWRFRQTRGKPAVSLPASLFSGAANDGSLLTFGRGLWMRLGSGQWQKVMWDPKLHDFTKGTVKVHGDLGRRARVVIELSNGTLLVPAGGLRRKPPRRIDLVRERHARLDDEQWIFPAGTAVPPQHRWWRQPALLCLVGALVGAFAGAGLGDVSAVPAMAAGFAGLAVNGWAMTSPAP